MRILLVAGSPAPSSSALVSRLAAQNDLVLAVDRGADACRAAGVVPGAFCGDTDTVSEEGLAWVRDQVFGVLAKNADLAPRLIEDEFECRILAPSGTETWALGEAALGSHFSFVALADDTCVSETGLRWELDHFHVDALRDRGISNVVDAADARVTCHEGILAAFLIN